MLFFTNFFQIELYQNCPDQLIIWIPLSYKEVTAGDFWHHGKCKKPEFNLLHLYAWKSPVSIGRITDRQHNDRRQLARICFHTNGSEISRKYYS